MKWRTRVLIHYDLEVEGDDYMGAQSNACADGARFAPIGAQVYAEVRQQLGEPWVYANDTRQRDDLCPKGQVDLLIFRRSTGNDFDAEDEQILLGRIRTMAIIDHHWNGAGCDSFSVKIARRAPLTPDEARYLCSPRMT